MTAYVTLSFPSLLDAPNDKIISSLLQSDSVSGYSQVSHNQIFAWGVQLDLLRDAAQSLMARRARIENAHLVLEYRIPRREKRIDAVVLLDRTIVLLEFKVGSSSES
jgi:hypothetical protein